MYFIMNFVPLITNAKKKSFFSCDGSLCQAPYSDNCSINFYMGRCPASRSLVTQQQMVQPLQVIGGLVPSFGDHLLKRLVHSLPMCPIQQPSPSSDSRPLGHRGV
jgi:hypothetical protein